MNVNESSGKRFDNFEERQFNSFKLIKAIRKPLLLRDYRKYLFSRNNYSLADANESVSFFFKRKFSPRLERICESVSTSDERYLFRRFFTDPHDKSPTLKDIFPESTLKDPELRAAILSFYYFQTLDDNLSKWERFRKLLKYYKDALLAENHSVSFSPEGLNETFILLHNIPNALPPRDDKSGCETIIDYSKENLEIFNNDLKHIAFGYPVEIQSIEIDDGSSLKLIRPIFYMTYDSSEFKKGRVHLYSSRNIKPEINNDWLERQFSKNQKAKYEFLGECGIASGELEDDESYSQYIDRFGSDNRVQTYRDIARIVSSRLKSKCRDSLNPQLLKTVSSLDELEDGIHNIAILGDAKYSKYVVGVLDDLSKIENCSDEELEQTALRFIFDGDCEPEIPKTDLDLIFNPAGLSVPNLIQKEAVASIIDNSVTVLQGPPGTGKTQVITNALINLRLRDKSALVISKNHQAIHAVMGRFDINNGRELITRGNAPKQDDPLGEDWKWFYKANDDLNVLSNDEEIEFQLKKDKLKALDKDAAALIQKLNEYDDLKDEIEHSEKNLKTYILRFFPYIESRPKLAAYFEDLKQGKAESKIIIKGLQLLKRTNSKSIFSVLNLLFSLNTRLQCNYLLGRFGFDERIKLVNNEATLKLVQDLHDRSCDCIDFSRLRQKFAELADAENKELFEKELMAKTIQAKNNYLGYCENYFKEDSKIRLKQSKKEKDLMSSVRTVLHPYGGMKGIDRLKVQDYNNYKHAVDAYKGILSTHPHWTCTTQSVPSHFPFIPGLFDIAIIDEAAQAEYITAIPALFRAKRVAVVGDPKQLKPIIKLSLDTDLRLMRKHNLDSFKSAGFSYRNLSLYDFVKHSNAANNIQLRESYRSCQSISDYISSIAYDNKLVCRTNESRLNLPAGFEPGILWRDVTGPFQKKDSSKFSEAEAKKTVECLENIFSSGFNGSVGVIAPYRPQAERIDSLCREKTALSGVLINQERLIISTVHKFQGSERDVIIFNLGLDESGQNWFVSSDVNLVNVAVSRAKSLLIVIGNKKLAENSEVNFIRLLARPMLNENSVSADYAQYGFESPYEQDIYMALTNRGFKPEIQKQVGYRRLDMALIDEKRKLDIEIDGRCHMGVTGIRKSDDYRRDEELRLHGFKTIRILTSEIRENLEDCVKRIIAAWEELGKESEHV